MDMRQTQIYHGTKAESVPFLPCRVTFKLCSFLFILQRPRYRDLMGEWDVFHGDTLYYLGT